MAKVSSSGSSRKISFGKKGTGKHKKATVLRTKNQKSIEDKGDKITRLS
jgi:hypothetical protein